MVDSTDFRNEDDRKDIQGQEAVDCNNIHDPVRRTLCKACGLPVMGDAPFCKDHEAEIP